MIQNTKYQIRDTKKGFTLIEALVMLFIFCLITITFYQVISVGTKYIIDAKNRLGAVSLADEKMEVVRNLAYDNIGTVNGEVGGNIPQDENVTENAHAYHVSTLVEYIDDLFDGTYPSDVAFEDYKRVTVIVSWSGAAGQEQVTLVSRFVPPGLEVANPGDGILFVNVYSDQPGGTGIPDATVHVINTDTGLNTEKQTGTDAGNLGNTVFMGDKVTDSIQKYQIEVTKPGYETVDTMPPEGTAQVPKPKFINATVVTGTGSTNATYIAQNKLAQDLTIAAVDHLGQPISNISFHLTGGKELGKDNSDNIIYNMDEDGKTGDDGKKDLGSVSPGKFTVTPTLTSSNYQFIEASTSSPFFLLSDQSLTYSMKLADKGTASLVVTVLNDDSTPAPISGAQVEAKNGSGYDVTKTTDAKGVVFFPADADPFPSGTYDLKVTASGFQDNASQATVSNNSPQTNTVTMTSS
jgi:competence protein ComGC